MLTAVDMSPSLSSEVTQHSGVRGRAAERLEDEDSEAAGHE